MSWNPQQPSQQPGYSGYGSPQQPYQQPSQSYETPIQPPRQNPRQITVSGHGLFGLVAIALMVGVAFILHWNIIWWYFVLAIFAYSIVIIFLTYEEERAKKQSEGRAGEYESSQEQAYREQMRFEIFRWLLGCHIAFLLLAGGLWLNAGNFFVQVGIFIAAAAAGLAIPFLLLRKK